jgi:hypothetical protein
MFLISVLLFTGCKVGGTIDVREEQGRRPTAHATFTFGS